MWAGKVVGTEVLLGCSSTEEAEALRQLLFLVRLNPIFRSAEVNL